MPERETESPGGANGDRQTRRDARGQYCGIRKDNDAHSPCLIVIIWWHLMLARVCSRLGSTPSLSRVICALTMSTKTTPPTPDKLASWRVGIGTAGWTHLNSAGAAPAHERVHNDMVAFLELERTIGGYAAVGHRKDAGGRDARDADEVKG